MSQELQDLALKLNALSRKMVAEENVGNDWALARLLEDCIGAGQLTGDDVERAESLLQKYGVS